MLWDNTTQLSQLWFSKNHCQHCFPFFFLLQWHNLIGIAEIHPEGKESSQLSVPGSLDFQTCLCLVSPGPNTAHPTETLLQRHRTVALQTVNSSVCDSTTTPAQPQGNQTEIKTHTFECTHQNTVCICSDPTSLTRPEMCWGTAASAHFQNGKLLIGFIASTKRKGLAARYLDFFFFFSFFYLKKRTPRTGGKLSNYLINFRPM